MRRPPGTLAGLSRLLLLLTLTLTVSGCGVVGFLRYGLTQARPGSLRAGDPAPDVTLVDLEGEPLQLFEHLDAGPDARPLVLAFGSFT